MNGARTGSVVFWLLIIGLVVFVLFNVVKMSGGTSHFTLFRTIGQYAPTPTTPSNSVGASTAPTPIPPAGIAVKDLSPLYKKVHIGSVSPASSYSYSQQGGQLSLYLDYGATQPIDVSDWMVIGNKGGEVRIPRAIVNFNPSISTMAPSTDIALEPGNTLNLYGWTNPLNVNFRLNKCTGYLNEHYAFIPTLPSECPRADNGSLIALSGQCQNFIRSFGTCVTLKPDELNRAGGFLEKEPACQALVDKQNQTACYNDHAQDPDFLSREWRVWLGYPLPFDQYHDHLILRDAHGLVVDDYTY